MRGANEISVIRACHKCKYFEGLGMEEYSERWCMAAGMFIPEARADEQQCGPDLRWWEPQTGTASNATAEPADVMGR